MLKMTKGIQEHTKGKAMVSDHVTFPSPLVAELRRRIEQAGTQKAAAEDLEISPQHLGDLLHGNRTASLSLLEKLGFVKISVHVPSELAVPVAAAIEQAISEARHLHDLRVKVGKK